MDHNENANKEDKKQTVLKTIAEFLPAWKNLDMQKVKLERMAGITNETYKVSHPDIETALIYRQFGDASDNIFLNREIEEFVYQFISDSKAGPGVFGLTEDIRIEEFIPSRVLKTKQMLCSSMVENVAFALRRFHEINPKTPKMKSQSLFSQIFFQNSEPILQKCHSKMKKPIFTQGEHKILQLVEQWVSQQQIEFLKKATVELEQNQLVFSHNDLLAGNVLIRSSDGRVIFIDYEYSCFNYRAYDIANYFNQSTYDYQVNESPNFRAMQLTPEQQEAKEKFIKCYAMAEEKDYQTYKKNIIGSELTEGGQKIYKQIKKNLLICQMLSDLMWGYWSIIVSKNPAIQFDYIEFCRARYDSYQSKKKLYLQVHKIE